MTVTVNLSPKPKFDPTSGVWIMEDDWKTVEQSLITAMHVARKGVEAGVLNTPAHKKTHAVHWLRACSTRLRLIQAPGSLLLKDVPQKVLDYAPEDAAVAYLPEIVGPTAAKVALAYGVGMAS